MIQLLSPLAWAAFGSLVIPVAIHLWSRGGRRRKRVGSLRFVETSNRRHLRSVHLTQLPLLVLRLFLLAVLATLLLRPAWVGTPRQTSSEPAWWTLVSPEALTPALLDWTAGRLDSLVAAGAEPRLLVPGFPRLEAISARTFSSPPGDVWSLLAEADRVLPPDSRLTIVGADRVASYVGARPSLGVSLEWMDGPPLLPSQWIAEGRVAGTDSLFVRVGWSDRSRLAYSSVQLRRGDISRSGAVPGVPGLVYEPGANRLVLAPSGRRARDTLTVRSVRRRRVAVVIADASRAEDARYVAAACRAIASVRGEDWDVSVGERWPEGEAFNAVFWLGGRTVPASLREQAAAGAVLITDADEASMQDVRRSLVPEPHAAGPALTLSTRTPAKGDGLPGWRDSTGEPLMETYRLGRGWHVAWHARFHPAAGDLVWSAAFPVVIEDLLQPEPEVPSRTHHDRRSVAEDQREPRRKEVVDWQDATAAPVPLRAPLWLLALVLFVFERWLDRRVKS